MEREKVVALPTSFAADWRWRDLPCVQVAILNLEIPGMLRKLIVVGDPPAQGGAVLPYGGPMSDVHGHRYALVGGRAYCQGCNSVGYVLYGD